MEPEDFPKIERARTLALLLYPMVNAGILQVKGLRKPLIRVPFPFQTKVGVDYGEQALWKQTCRLKINPEKMAKALEAQKRD